jgi:protein O-GlcNAc transferase
LVAPQPNDLLEEALLLHRRGAVAEATARYSALLQAEPHHADAHYYLGLIACQQGRFDDGAQRARQALSGDPRHAPAHVLLGRALAALGQHEEALATLDRALALAPESAQAHGHRADVLSDLGRHGEAVEAYDRALAAAPDRVEDWFNRGTALAALDRHGEAVASFERAIAGRPDDARAYVAQAKSLSEEGLHEASLGAIERALAMAPNFAEAWQGRGNVYLALKRYDDASSAFDKALALRPEFAEAWLGRGNVFYKIRRHGDASAAYDQALALEPDLAAAWLGRGNVFADLKRHDEAFAAYGRALALDPDLAGAWLGRGNVFMALAQYEEAFAAYDKAAALDPDLNYAAAGRMHAKLHLCDWTNLKPEAAELLSISRERAASAPFALLAIPSSPHDLLQCARRYVKDQPHFSPLWRGEIYSHDRIRIAYLSADFREHPIAHLTVGVFENHDRSRFDVTGISFGSDRSPVRERIKAAFERFIEVDDKSDQDIAELIKRSEIDIAVDLTGHTQDSRFSVFARRPAPIQVNYLGYLGTLGAKFIDYVIADQIALPFDQQPYFDEKIIHLPDCFVVTDDRQEIATWNPSRQEAGLPADGFVFCCFNNSYKLTPPLFEAWMRMLRAIPGSVLWLARSNDQMIANLRREAERCRVDSARLVFAARLPLPQHLARQRLAGLFLDTAPYNAGATAVAALWSGVPILTIRGETFAGRMAASMLNAIGLPELVTHNLDDYEAFAVKLAREPSLLAELRQRLEENRRRMPLFGTDRFCRHLEQAYTTMVEIQRRGEPPRSFGVEPK